MTQQCIHLTQYFCDEHNCNIFILEVTGKPGKISKAFCNQW